jgi:hypothetical protein
MGHVIRQGDDVGGAPSSAANRNRAAGDDRWDSLHKSGCDLTEATVDVSLSWEYDWKNEPVEPVVDIEGVISFSTWPWRTLEDFEKRRDIFEDWRCARRRVLKTSSDYFDLMEWNAQRSTRKALRTNSRSVLPNLARAIVVLVARRPLRERPSYNEIAEIFSRDTGCRVSEHLIKNIRAKRDQISPQCVSQLSTADIAFAKVYGANPIAVDQMRSSIIPGSIAERQFSDIWERRLSAPVLKIVNDAPVSTEEPPVMLVAVATGHGEAHQVGTPVKSASLTERAALAGIVRVIEPEQATERTRLDQARVDKWIRDRVVVDWRDSCWRCRKPIVVGQGFVDVRGDEATIRFHNHCHGEWKVEQETLARRELGLREEKC